MNILVTGAAGFIGSHLVRALTRRGHRVTGVDRKHGRPTTDLPAFQQTVDAAQPDVIAHLGASCSTSRSLTNPAADFTDNAIGTFNVAEAARHAGNIPVIYTSTVKVHPGADGKVAPLGLSKRIGEDYLRLYGDLYDVPSVILRPSTVYGPGQDGTAESGWVTWFLRALWNRQQITIHGDGTQSRDILYIDDMTRLLVDTCENFDAYRRVDPYDVGGGPDNELSLLDLLKLWEADTGARPDVVHDARLPGDLQRVVTDNTAINTVRGWAPTTSWLDGVRQTLAWIGDQR
ncbi:NAD-dependent epimerase/dehydratase family protein [Streptomyces sp. FL07-04A]|uniref:NAD-dependent epimerase/dehydratase family protein n=1 Tax=Streptomyces sp. FL07-04A TaxID=3028658 RepID=UPI0029A8720A|nr:NAD-dependent epimerase/dehydratase family protein [Streptomyces sp. FL07-04A]MDX3575997.1 NAD-dependent epimerase/dehydratase family protein [Streptomyces sp. FL07-04A]